MKKWFLCAALAFFAQVRIPMGLNERYEIESFKILGDSGVYALTLSNGKIMYTPVIFTVITER